jgi:hypothetical protein
MGKRILQAIVIIVVASGAMFAQTGAQQGQSSPKTRAASGATKNPIGKATEGKTEGMPAPPVLWIDREIVPAERAEAYADVIHRTLNLYNQHQIVFRALGLTSALPDTNEFFFLIQFHSFAELDEFERKFAQAPADYQKTMQSLEAQEADLRKSRQVIAAVFRPDLSYHADASALARARLLWVDQFIVTLGKMPEYEGDVKFLIAAYEKAGIDDHYFTYQALAGAESQTMIVVHPMKALADWDHSAEITKKVEKVLGAAGKKRMERLWKDQMPQGVGVSVERLYVLRPDLSQTSDKFAGFDPDFWRPKKE